MTSKDHSPEIIEAHGLTIDEYDQIKRLLERTPNITELGVFSAMWNEHCSYKSSRKGLRNFQQPEIKLSVVLEKMQELWLLMIALHWHSKWKVIITPVT